MTWNHGAALTLHWYPLRGHRPSCRLRGGGGKLRIASLKDKYEASVYNPRSFRSQKNLDGLLMNYLSLALATLGGMVAYFAYGFLLMWLVPALIDEAHKYPDVFRPKEKIMAVMPIGMAAMLIAILVVAIIFAMIQVHQGGSGIGEGARVGVLIGIFVVCGFVVHNYVNLNIGLKLTLMQAVAYVVQWIIVGAVIGLIYKPLATP
jgi:hypothetical protein